MSSLHIGATARTTSDVERAELEQFLGADAEDFDGRPSSSTIDCRTRAFFCIDSASVTPQVGAADGHDDAGDAAAGADVEHAAAAGR